MCFPRPHCVNTLRPRQNGHHFADDTFKRIFLNENIRISIKISLKFVPNGPIKTISALVQIMAWRRPGDKPLSEPMMVRSLTHICVTRPQWVKQLAFAFSNNSILSKLSHLYYMDRYTADHLTHLFHHEKYNVPYASLWYTTIYRSFIEHYE